MALQSSIRSSLLVIKLGQCGRARTFASSRPGKPPTFGEVQHLRQKQAKRSLLVQVASVKSSGSLGTYLEQYGTVSSLYHYTTDKKEFLFVEMSSREEAEAVIRCTHHPHRDQVVPVSSPLLWLRSGGDAPRQPADAPPRDTLPPVIQEPTHTQAKLGQQIAECPTLDEQLLRHHELTRLTELGARLRYFSCELLQRALAGLFPHVRARPFGSSANGFGRHDCDVDMVLELAPARTAEMGDRLAFQTMAAKKDGRTQTQRYLNFLGDMLVSLMPGCTQVRRILKARVPIVKYTQSLTGVDCDLSMARIGMQMTELLYIWSQLDPRVAPLVGAVRHWAEKAHLTNCLSGSGRFISNFGITLLVIYFLQTRPVPVLPSVNELTQLARPGDTARVDGGVYSFLRDPSLVPPTANTETLSDLLAAFFALYADLDLNSHALSVVWGGQFGHPGDAPLHVQNPLDLELNVTKNVSHEEVRRLQSEAERAGHLLRDGRWWELLLGGDLAAPLCTPLSVRALFDEETEEEEVAARDGDSLTVGSHAAALGAIRDTSQAKRSTADKTSPASVQGAKAAKVGSARASRRAEDSVKLATLLGSARGAGGWGGAGAAPFSALRLGVTVDGDPPASDRATSGDQRAQCAMALLDATPPKQRPKKRKAKKKRQAGG